MDRSCDDDQTWMVVKPGGKRSKDELREACLLTAKLLPPKVFAKAIKAMIMQAQLLRGNALSVMQEEIKSVVSRATHEREAKRHRCAQDAPEPTAAMHCARACDQAPLSLFLATPITAEDDCCWDLDDTGRSTPSASAKIHGTNPQKTEKEELDKRSFVDEIFAHSCLSCGWPIAHCQTQGTCRVGNGKDHA